ncbi:hypothetical protein ACIP5Y_42325 [Nocardia sp. NPDC088792]
MNLAICTVLWMIHRHSWWIALLGIAGWVLISAFLVYQYRRSANPERH